MRLFFAINFSRQTHLQLIDHCNKLRIHAISGFFSLPENLHLTLAFLGECDAKQLAIAEQAATSVKFEPFSMTISGGGYLDKGRPNLVFCG